MFLFKRGARNRRRLISHHRVEPPSRSLRSRKMRQRLRKRALAHPPMWRRALRVHSEDNGVTPLGCEFLGRTHEVFV